MAIAIRNTRHNKIARNVFMYRYGQVLEAAARRVHSLALRGQVYTSTSDLADYIVSSLPTLARKTWGKNLKSWRVTSMLSNAKFLGAYEALDIKAVRGRGLTTVVRPRLRLVK